VAVTKENDMDIRTITLVALAGALTASLVAQAPPQLKKFQSGEPARAAEVNGNFEYVLDRIGEIPKGDKGDPGPTGQCH